LQAAAAFSNLGLLLKPPDPNPEGREPDPGVNVGRVPPVGMLPWVKFGSVTPCCLRQLVYAVSEAVPEGLVVVVPDPLAELPQAASSNGTTPTSNRAR
jgi:hypothetical protein